MQRILMITTLATLMAIAGSSQAHNSYPDDGGNIKSITPVQNGQRQGQAQGWWPGGELQYQRRYENGLIHGETREYYRSGQLRYQQNFEYGIEAGLQLGWHEDGEPVIAYAYRDGRRYGVLGSQPCFTANPEATEVFNETND